MSSHPPDIGPSLEGAELAKDFLCDVERINARAKAMSGELLFGPIADRMELLMADPATRRGFVLAMSEYLANAVDGVPIDLARWEPCGSVRFRR